MKRILLYLALIASLTSCSTIPGNFIASILDTPPTIVCPTCPPTLECPIIPTETEVTPTEVVFPSKTSTLEPTSTLVPTDEPTLTPSPIATATLTPTATPLLPSPSSTMLSYPYKLQSGSPGYTQNFAHPNEGCNWMGIAGQVFDKDGKPQKNLVIVLTGKYDNKPIDQVSLTGSAPSYGPAGFEITLGSKLTAETQLYLAVYNLAGSPQSPNIQISTQADCKKNLVIVNFIRQ